MALTISHLSKEYVRVPVRATEAGAPVDPTADTVTMAFAAAGVQPSSWNTASWETDPTATPARYFARCLVGPGAVVLAAGRYVVWLKITDNPEAPVLAAGDLTVT